MKFGIAAWSEIETIIDTSNLWKWIQGQKMTIELFNSRPTSREEKWWGKSVVLSPKSSLIFPAPTIEGEPILQDLRDRYYPESNSILLYKYHPGVGISTHSNKPIFARRVVLINLLERNADLFGNETKCEFRYGRLKMSIGDGDVVEFDAQVPHSIPPVKTLRYSISLRVVEG